MSLRQLVRDLNALCTASSFTLKCAFEETMHPTMHYLTSMPLHSRYRTLLSLSAPSTNVLFTLKALTSLGRGPMLALGPACAAQ